jgi:hypothetical protein
VKLWSGIDLVQLIFEQRHFRDVNLVIVQSATATSILQDKGDTDLKVFADTAGRVFGVLKGN